MKWSGNEKLHALDTYLGQPETSFRVCLIKLWPPEAGAVGLFDDIMIIRKAMFNQPALVIFSISMYF